MASDLGTQIGPARTQAETRAKAARYLESSGNADLLPMLGLVDEPRTVGERPACPTCGRPRQKGKHGGYRPCQRQACPEVPDE